MVKSTDTRQAVLDAASRLFHMYGYNGTSVRAISAEAGVNVALISYYFGGKKALLEQLMETFLKGYLSELERFIEEKEQTSVDDGAIVDLARHLLNYQAENYYMARFVFREITMDSILTREIMTTYLMKEKYLLEAFFKRLNLREAKHGYFLDFLIMQFRNMVMLPFSQPQYIQKVYGLQPTQTSFLYHYLKHVDKWAKGLTSNSQAKTAI